MLAARHVHTVVTHLSIPHAIAAPVVGERTLAYFAHEFHLGTHWTERWAKLSRRPDVVLAGSEFDATGVPNLFTGIQGQVVYYATELPPRGDVSLRSRSAASSTPPRHRVIVTPARFSAVQGTSSARRSAKLARAS